MKSHEKKLDSATMNTITEQLEKYIDSIKEDIGYEELDRSVEKDEIIKLLIQYYTNNPLDDTMSYDDWVNDFIDGNNLRENSYKPQIKDYLRNIVAIIYSNLSEVEEDHSSERTDFATNTKYVLAEYINIADDAANFRMNIAENGIIPHHITNVPITIGANYKNRELLALRAEEKVAQHGKIYLVQPIPGAGKKTFAKELYLKINSKYKHSAWIRLDGTLKQSLMDSLVIYPATADSEIRYAQILAFLKTKKNSTIIFIDNSFGFTLTQEEFYFLDQISASVVFINDPQIGTAEPFEVFSLPIDQCIDVFYEYYALDKSHKFIDTVNEYVELADKNLFLIKMLAKAAKGYNLVEFLHRIKNDGIIYNDLSSVDRDDAAILIGRNLLRLIKIANLSDVQYEILKYFTIMPDIDVPQDIIISLCDDKAAVDALCNYGILECSEKINYGTVYYIHPLMRKAISMQFDVKPSDCRKLLSLIINGSYIKSEDRYAQFITKIKIAEGVLNAFSRHKFDEKGELFNAVGCWFFNCGEFEKSYNYIIKALNIREKIPVINHPSTAIVYHNLARACSALQNYDMAIEYATKAIEIYENYSHQYTASISSLCIALGIAYTEKQNFDMAEKVYLRALDLRKEKGTPPMKLAHAYSKLGALYNEMKQPEKAIEFHLNALKIKEKVLGMDNPETAVTYNLLALIYKEQNDLEKALEFNNKTLRIRERVLGTEHPLTARTYSHLGKIYLIKEDYQKSLSFYVKSYKIVKHIYGESDIKTRRIKDNLEATYRRQFEKWLSDSLGEKEN